MAYSVLVAEDEPNIVLSLQFIMKKAGFQVRVAEDGVQAVLEVEKERPDVVLLDIMLPKRDGFSVCEIIKSNPEWADRIAEIPPIDPKAVDAIAQAEFAALAAESLATQYVASINSQMTSIGFTTAMTSASNTAGFSGIGMYENIALLSAMRRTNFSNTEIIGESRNKLNLTNSQVNAIRFNSTRGDIELQDRLRYVDQLDAMASGTSPL